MVDETPSYPWEPGYAASKRLPWDHAPPQAAPAEEPAAAPARPLTDYGPEVKELVKESLKAALQAGGITREDLADREVVRAHVEDALMRLGVRGPTPRFSPADRAARGQQALQDAANEYPYTSAAMSGMANLTEGVTLGAVKGERAIQGLSKAAQMLGKEGVELNELGAAQLRAAAEESVANQEGIHGVGTRAVQLAASYPGLYPALGATRLIAGKAPGVVRSLVAGGAGFGGASAATQYVRGSVHGDAPTDAGSITETAIREGAIGAILPGAQSLVGRGLSRLGASPRVSSAGGGAAGFAGLEAAHAPPGERLEAAAAGALVGGGLGALHARRFPKRPQEAKPVEPGKVVESKTAEAAPQKRDPSSMRVDEIPEVNEAGRALKAEATKAGLTEVEKVSLTWDQWKDVAGSALGPERVKPIEENFAKADPRELTNESGVIEIPTGDLNRRMFLSPESGTVYAIEGPRASAPAPKGEPVEIKEPMVEVVPEKPATVAETPLPRDPGYVAVEEGKRPVYLDPKGTVPTPHEGDFRKSKPTPEDLGKANLSEFETSAGSIYTSPERIERHLGKKSNADVANLVVRDAEGKLDVTATAEAFIKADKLGRLLDYGLGNESKVGAKGIVTGYDASGREVMSIAWTNLNTAKAALRRAGAVKTETRPIDGAKEVLEARVAPEIPKPINPPKPEATTFYRGKAVEILESKPIRTKLGGPSDKVRVRFEDGTEKWVNVTALSVEGVPGFTHRGKREIPFDPDKMKNLKVEVERDLLSDEGGAIDIGVAGRVAGEALVNPAALRERVSKGFSEVGGALMSRYYKLASKSPVLNPLYRMAERLGAKPPDSGLAEKLRLKDAEAEKLRAMVYEVEDAARAINTESGQRDFWLRAERGTVDPTYKHQAALDALSKIVFDTGDALFRAKQITLATKTKFRQPGQAYVRRMPKFLAADGTSKDFRKNTIALMSRIVRENGLMGRSLAEQLNGVSSLIKQYTKRRINNMTPEEVLESGEYITNVIPIIKTAHDQAKILTQLKYIEGIKNDLPHLWRDVPKGTRQEVREAFDDPNWITVRGRQWGVLDGKQLRAEVYPWIQAGVDPVRSGLVDLLSLPLQWSREKVTIFRFGYHAKQMLFDSPLQASMTGLPLTLAIPRVAQAAKYMAAVQRGDVNQPYYKELRATGLLDDAMRAMEIYDRTAPGNALGREYTDIQSTGRQYGAEFRELAFRNLESRLEGLLGTAERGALKQKPLAVGAEIASALRDAVVGYEPARHAGLGKVHLSGQQLREIAKMSDNLWKYASYIHLRETGGAGVIQGAAQLVAGKHGATHEQAVARLRENWDASQVSPFIKGVGRAVDFIRYPYIHARNAFAKGYVIDNPVGSALALSFSSAVHTVGIALAAKSLGMAKDELEAIINKQIEASSGGDPKRAGSMAAYAIWRDDDGKIRSLIGDFRGVESVAYWDDFLSPSARVAPKPGEHPAMKTVRGLMTYNVVSGDIAKLFGGMEVYTGAESKRLTSTFSRFLEVAGLVIPTRDIANTLAKIDSNKRAIAAGREPIHKGLPLALNVVLGIQSSYGYPEGSREFAGQMKLVDRYMRALEVSEYGSGTRVELNRPKHPGDDASEEQLLKYREDVKLYFKEKFEERIFRGMFK